MKLEIFPSTTLERLRNEYHNNGIQLAQIQSDAPWRREAQQYLEACGKMIAAGNVEGGWRALHAAREALAGSWDAVECLTQIERLRPETLAKLSNWRAETVSRLLELAKDHFSRGDLYATQSVLREVLKLRHEHFSNDYHKLWSVRSQIYGLAKLAMGVVGLLVGLALLFPWNAWCGGSPAHVLGAVLFGALGACVSSAQGLMKGSPEGKIPDLFAQNTVSWARVGFGTAMGLVAVVGLESGILNLGPVTPLKSMIVAFAAGFSEKLVVGLAGKVGGH